MQVLDSYYLNGVNFHKKTTPVGDLKCNFDNILPIINTTFADQFDGQGNVQSYPRKSHMGDADIMALALLQEALRIDSERWFWSKLQSDYHADFPNLPHRSNYNRRHKQLADKGYLSATRQIDLFYSAGIDLQTLMRRNQKQYRPWPKIFKTARRRIETVFSQLCGQMMLKRNYAETFSGLRARIISKVAATTLLQYINWLNDKPINHIKHALAA